MAVFVGEGLGDGVSVAEGLGEAVAEGAAEAVTVGEAFARETVVLR